MTIKEQLDLSYISGKLEGIALSIENEEIKNCILDACEDIFCLLYANMEDVEKIIKKTREGR